VISSSLHAACQQHNTRCCSVYTGLDCDISVASGAARFKSTVLRYLADIDNRFGSLVRLVKLWAGAHGMNDAAAGTFNSFALTLMVRVHTAYCLSDWDPGQSWSVGTCSVLNDGMSDAAACALPSPAVVRPARRISTL